MLPASTYHASDGAAYEVFLGRWSRELAPRLLDFAGFAEDGPLIDIGTGTGSLANAMAARWPRRAIVGLDVAAPYIAYAKGRSAGTEPTFAVGDATALAYGDGVFAGAAAQLVLNFIPNALAAVCEMRRVTSPGGTIVAAVWDFRGGLVYQRLFWDPAAGVDAAAADARDRLFSGALALPDGLLALFGKVGLRRIERGSLTIRMNYANFGDYWGPLLGGQGPVGSYLASRDHALRRRLEEAVRRAYCSGLPDGERSLTATAWAVRGTVP